MSLEIGVVPEPESSEHWEALQAFLRPAADRGGLDSLLDENELLWAVLEENRPIAAATARLLTDGTCEVALVGGIDHRKWLKPLDDAIGRAAREAGALRLRAYGRRGWARVLGWKVLGEREGFTGYERDLRADGQEI